MNSSRARKGALALTMTAGVLALAACGGDTDTLAKIQDEGTIVVGIAGEEPYSYTDENGELTGATIALHKEIFANLGVDNVEATLVDWDALIPGLNAERFDVVSAGMSILPERCEQADFGDPEIMYTTALLVPEGNPEGLQNMQDIEAADVNFAAMSGAIEQGYADSLGIDTMIVNSPQDGLDAVVSGRADVYALTGISLRAMAENNPDAPVEVTDPFVAEVDGIAQVGAGATVFRQGDDEFRDAYNEELAKIVGDPAEYERVIGEFGFTEAERPTEDITTEMLCAGDLPAADEVDTNPGEGDDSGTEESNDAENTDG